MRTKDEHSIDSKNLEVLRQSALAFLSFMGAMVLLGIDKPLSRMIMAAAVMSMIPPLA